MSTYRKTVVHIGMFTVLHPHRVNTLCSHICLTLHSQHIHDTAQSFHTHAHTHICDLM